MAKIIRQEESIVIIPDKKYPKGHDLEISITPDMAVFHINMGNGGPNVQIRREELETVIDTLKLAMDPKYYQNIIEKIKN